MNVKREKMLKNQQIIIIIVVVGADDEKEQVEVGSCPRHRHITLLI